MSKPLTQADLVAYSVSGQPVPADRVLATFADPSNWVQVHVDNYCHWAWCGPVRPPYELSSHAAAGCPPDTGGIQFDYTAPEVTP